MSDLITRLTPIGWFDVGETPDASNQYPILRISETHAREGNEGDNAPHLRRVSLRIDSVTEASSETTNAVNERLQTQLARRGARVRVNEMNGTARVFGAGSASGGALAGYPRVTVEMIPDNSVPPFQFFRVSVEALIPIAANLPAHTFTRDEETDETGQLTIRQRGSVRVANGESPKIWLVANVIAPAIADANSQGRKVRHVIKLLADPTLAEYEYTNLPPGLVPPGDPNIDEAEVRDVTVEERAGRRVRTVSGFATGVGATAFATNQNPASPSVLLLRKSVSEPSVPQGRVDFTYEALDGYTSGAFPGVVIFDFAQDITEAGGGRDAITTIYADAEPEIELGGVTPQVVRESTSIVFRGAFEDVEIAPRLNADNIVGRPGVSMSSRAGVKTLRVDRAYLFKTPVELPTPLEVSAL